MPAGKLARSFLFALIWLTPVAVLVGPRCSRVSDPVGNTGQGILHARNLYVEAKTYQAEHGQFPDLPTVLEAMQRHYPGDEPYVPSIESVKDYHPRLHFISTLEATDGQFVFSASAPFRRDYRSSQKLYRIVVPSQPDAAGTAQFVIEEAAFQEVLAKVQQAVVENRPALGR